MTDEPPSGDVWEVEARVVRPYIFTGGRTRARGPELAVEATLEATPTGYRRAGRLPPEQRRVVELCERPVSVAELAARLCMPLGVVRVLVTEMVAAQHIQVHQVDPVGTDLAAVVELLQRLIARVKAIPA